MYGNHASSSKQSVAISSSDATNTLCAYAMITARTVKVFVKNAMVSNEALFGQSLIWVGSRELVLKRKKKGKAWLPDGRFFLKPNFIQAWRAVTQPSHRQQLDERVTVLGGAGSFVTKPSLSDCQNINLSEPFSIARYSLGLHVIFRAYYYLEDKTVPCGTLVPSFEEVANVQIPDPDALCIPLEDFA